ERPALTRQCSRLSSYHVHRPACSSRSSPFLEGALRQLRWLRACRSKTNTNARSRIDRRPRVPRMRPITIHTRETNGTERPPSDRPWGEVGASRSGVAHAPAASELETSHCCRLLARQTAPRGLASATACASILYGPEVRRCSEPQRSQDQGLTT